MYDAIVIGARCAGAATALLLARRGYRTLVVDRSSFPSEIRRGHLIHRHGPGRLHRWGLLDRVAATGCPAITSISNDLGDFPLVGEDLVVDGVAVGYGPRRGALDQVLIQAAVDVPNFLRRPYGPGWALVGDAGCHKDTYLALGVCDAFRDAELLVDAIDAGLSGGRDLDAALAAYERRRNEATLPDYRQNMQLARFAPPPPPGLSPEEQRVDQMRLRASVRGDREATRQFFMAHEGLIPREAFLAAIRDRIGQASA